MEGWREKQNQVFQPHQNKEENKITKSKTALWLT